MDDQPLVPEAMGRPTRYQMDRKKPKPWTVPEEQVLSLVLASCDSEAAHIQAALLLCRLFGRKPEYTEDDRPTLKRKVTDCVDLLEAKVWKMVSGYEGWRPKPLPLSPRSGMVLSWGEKHLFLLPRYKLVKEKKTYLPLSYVPYLIGRTLLNQFDTKVIGHYLHSLRGNYRTIRDKGLVDALLKVGVDFENAVKDYLKDPGNKTMDHLAYTLGIRSDVP